MGMFDWFEPEPIVACPRCGEPVDGWQGKQGPCALLVWVQGVARPIAQRVDEDARLDDTQLATFTLPDEFEIYGECPNGHETILRCRCTDGIWTQATLEDTVDLARFWFEFDVSQVGPPEGEGTTIDGGTLAHRFCGLGVGVTAFDRADALSLIEQVLAPEPIPPIVHEERDPDVSELAEGMRRLRAVGTSGLGVPIWRGIWFPALNRSGPETGPSVETGSGTPWTT